MLFKEPNIKVNKHAMKAHSCKYCRQIIYDLSSSKYARVFKDNLQGIILSSNKSPVVCKACAGEECPQNYKHEVVLLENGLHYCKQCRKTIETRQSYRDHMNENEIDVVAHVTPLISEFKIK